MLVLCLHSKLVASINFGMIAQWNGKFWKHSEETRRGLCEQWTIHTYNTLQDTKSLCLFVKMYNQCGVSHLNACAVVGKQMALFWNLLHGLMMSNDHGYCVIVATIFLWSFPLCLQGWHWYLLPIWPGLIIISLPSRPLRRHQGMHPTRKNHSELCCTLKYCTTHHIVIGIGSVTAQVWMLYWRFLRWLFRTCFACMVPIVDKHVSWIDYVVGIIHWGGA